MEPFTVAIVAGGVGLGIGSAPRVQRQGTARAIQDVIDAEEIDCLAAKWKPLVFQGLGLLLAHPRGQDNPARELVRRAADEMRLPGPAEIRDGRHAERPGT